MGGGEILRMILLDSKNHVENEDPVRPKTGMKAHDISEIDSLIFAERSNEGDIEEPQRLSDDVIREDSGEFSHVQRTDSRQQAGRRKTWKQKKPQPEPEEDIFEKAMK